MLFKRSNLNSNLALTLGYLNPASNNSAPQLDSRHQVYLPALFVTHIVLSHSTVCTSPVGFIHTSYKQNKHNRIEKRHIWNTLINHGCRQYTVLIFWLLSLTMYHVVIVGIVPCSNNDRLQWVNPLSPNGDQHQFSPNNIHTLSRDKVMRIYKMINKGKMLWSAIKFSQLILKGNVWSSVWRISMWILGLKGLMQYQ